MNINFLSNIAWDCPFNEGNDCDCDMLWPSLPGQARCLFDVVVLQDKSGSITDKPNFFQNWVDTRFFLVDFMTKFATADTRLVQLAFVTFASLQQLWFGFGNCTTAECVEEAVYKPGAPVSC